MPINLTEPSAVLNKRQAGAAIESAVQQSATQNMQPVTLSDSATLETVDHAELYAPHGGPRPGRREAGYVHSAQRE